MYQEMRRKDRLLPDEEIVRILTTASYGVLSTVSEDGNPYGVPISFVYKDGRIYFHSASVGHKLDNIKLNHHISFCAVTDVETLPDKFATKYRSVIAFGEATELYREEKTEIFKLFLEKYAINFMESGMEYIKKAGGHARIFKIDVQHVTAKGKR